jgi:hypothetical protein
MQRTVFDPRVGHVALPLFDGFPYLVTRVVTNLNHHLLLPGTIHSAELKALGLQQVQANRLPSCIVLAPDQAIFIDPDLTIIENDAPPLGGFAITGRIAGCWSLSALDLNPGRERRLHDYVAANRGEGWITGDGHMGGREASGDDLRRLMAHDPDSVPVGLSRCTHCRDYRGECLHQNEQYRGYVITVRCSCENWNACARCGKALAARRLNAPYWDPDVGRPINVPGFMGLKHQC